MKQMSLYTAVPRTSNKQRIGDFIRERDWKRLAAAEWAELRSTFAGVTERVLRDAVQQTGVKVAQPWAGVNTHTLDGLQQSLIELAALYAGDESLRRYIRSLVIEAKDRARGASRNARVDAAKRTIKVEMVEWLLVWLGDPALFVSWVGLRRGISNSIEPY